MTHKFIWKALLVLLLTLPLSAQIDTATGLSQGFDCTSPCAFGNYTVPAAATDQILILALTARYSSSHDFSGASCSVGGVTATLAVRAHTTSVSTQTALFYILDASLPAAGVQAVSCTHSSINTRSGIVRVQMLSGRAQSAPEDTAQATGTATTLSLDLTTTDEAVVVWAAGHDADPGAESPAADVDLGAVDGRYHESLAVLETTGGSVAVDPSWANSVASHGVSASFAPAASDDVVVGTSTGLTDADGCPLPCTLGSVTVPSGTDRMALVSVYSRGDSGWTSRTATLGGASLIEIQKSPGTASTNELVNFCLLDANFPATGSRDLILGGSNGPTSSGSAIVTFLTNAQQVCPVSNAAINSSSSATSVLTTRTPVAAGALYYHTVITSSDRQSTLAATSPQTLALKQTTTGTHAASYEVLASTAAADAGFTWTTVTAYRSGGFIIESAAEVPPVPAIAVTDVPVVECFCPGLFDVPSQSLPNGLESAAYTSTQLAVLGGVEPRTWAVTGGALPAGLSLSSGGVISGTPDAATAGSYNFEVEVTDADGGLAYRDLTLVVDVASAGSLAFYEDAEDGNLTSSPTWTAAGGCAVTSTGVLEGNDEVTKSTATDCVPFDNVDEAQVFFGIDLKGLNPTTSQDQVIVAVDSVGDVLFSVRIESDGDIFTKTPGQTGFELSGVPRGFYMGQQADDYAYLEVHYVAGTGASALFEARIDGGAIQQFSAGTATTNVDRIILRNANDSAADFVFDRIEAKDDDWPGRGPLIVDPPPDPGEPGPWVTDFIPVRTHYVTQNGSGSANGTIGNPESFATALGHHTCGDLHVARAGTYSPPGGGNTLPSTYISQNCTENAPKVWKGYVDPATGQPENVVWPFGILQPRRWHWFVGIHHNLEAVAPCAVSGLESRHAGNRIINGVVHDARHQNLAFWRTAGTSEPGQVIYGTVSYTPDIIGCLTVVQPSHPMYGQNHFPTDGYKYVVQSIFVRPFLKGGRRVWQTNDTHGDRGISGWHLEKNFFGDANHDNESIPSGATAGAAVLNAYSAPNPWNDTFDQSDHMILKDNFFVDFFHSPALRESVHASDHQQPWVGQVTGNYFARANFIAGGYWGSTDSPEQYVFTGNEIYDPPGGYHVKLETVIDNQEAGPRGGFKIPDGDSWNNNVYGGTFKGRLWCNGTNFGDRTLTQWRSDTDGCRATPASAVGFDIDSTNPANPTTDKVVVTVNEYQCPVGCPFTDQARGNIYAVNWDGNSTVSADISSVVGFGKTYVVRYATDFFGTAAASGTCPGSGACPVTLPSRRSAADSAGRFSNYYVITGQP